MAQGVAGPHHAPGAGQGMGHEQEVLMAQRRFHPAVRGGVLVVVDLAIPVAVAGVPTDAKAPVSEGQSGQIGAPAPVSRRVLEAGAAQQHSALVVDDRALPLDGANRRAQMGLAREAQLNAQVGDLVVGLVGGSGSGQSHVSTDENARLRLWRAQGGIGLGEAGQVGFA